MSATHGNNKLFFASPLSTGPNLERAVCVRLFGPRMNGHASTKASIFAWHRFIARRLDEVLDVDLFNCRSLGKVESPIFLPLDGYIVIDTVRIVDIANLTLPGTAG